MRNYNITSLTKLPEGCQDCCVWCGQPLIQIRIGKHVAFCCDKAGCLLARHPVRYILWGNENPGPAPADPPAGDDGGLPW